MKTRFEWPVILLLLMHTALMAGQLQDRLPANASLEGIVLISPSGGPLSRAQVTLTLQSDDTAPEIPPVFTREDGKFSFPNLEPGRYQVRVARNGYIPQTSGQRISLVAGQSLKNLTFRLVQGSVVTGHIRDAGGQPLTGMQVFLMRTAYTWDGKRSLSVVQGTFTDDRGEYRLYWIPAGRYYLSTGQFLRERPEGFGPEVIADQDFPITYYPGEIDLRRAVPIELRPGAELGAMDIILQAPRTYRISGRVVDEMTGLPPEQVELGLTARTTDNIAIDREDRHRYRTSYESTTGKFEMRGVPLGAYWLFGSAPSRNVDPSLPFGGKLTIWPNYAEAAVDVVASDVEGVVLTVSPGVTVPVRVTVERDQTSVLPDFHGVDIRLKSLSARQFEISTQDLDANGAGRLQGASPGEYKAIAYSVPGLYVRGINYGRTDALNSSLQITKDGSGVLEVALSSRGAQIDGIVRNAVNEPVADVAVELIPDQPRERVHLFKRVVTDAAGRFVFRDIAPGSYKAFAWEALEPYAYFDGDVLAQYENKGAVVRVQESSKQSIDVRLIPATIP